jgi:diaminopimelate decarboxylase
MSPVFPVKKFRVLPTPFYYYDLDSPRSTLAILKKESSTAG